MTRILVVDRETAVLQRIVFDLQSAGYAADTARSFRDALTRMSAARPDLILFDSSLPQTTRKRPGETLLQLSRRHGIPLILLTAKASPAREFVPAASADDYVSKPFSGKELLVRIRAILRRSSPQGLQDSIEIAGLQLDDSSQRLSAGGREIRLGPTDYRLMQFFMSHPGCTFSRGQLIDQLWGSNAGTRKRAVHVNIRRLRRALQAVELDSLIRTVPRAGYGFFPPDGPPAAT